MFLLLPLLALHAAQPCVEISRTYADLEINPQSTGVALKQTPDGGYLLAGTRQRTAESEDIYLLKTDRQAAATRFWPSSRGGAGSSAHEASSCLARTWFPIVRCIPRSPVSKPPPKAGTSSPASSRTVPGTSSRPMLPGRSNGAEISVAASPGHDRPPMAASYQRISEGLALYGGALQPLPDGGYLLAGNAEYTANKVRRLYLLRTDDRGEQLWDKVFDDRPNRRAHSLREGAGGTFVMGADGRSLFGVDGSGEIIWERKFPLPVVGGAFADVERTADGGHAAIASGLGSRPAGLFLVKLAPLPGEAQVFRRGEANDDGVVDLSDSVRILNVLFLGDGRLACRDAADFNDDGAVDISDPIGLLTFLFLGGPAAPLPGRTGCCGADPTPDGMTCETFASCS